MNVELVKVVDVANRLGEAVLWDAESASVWWTDILSQKLYAFHISDERLKVFDTPEELACFAFVEGHDYLLAGFASGFAYFDPLTGSVDWICKIESDNPLSRLNDGRTDRQGRFWAGSLSTGDENDGLGGALYRLDSNHQVHRHLSAIEISNSLCWSPQSDFLYHCDTPTRTIQRYSFNPSTAEIDGGTDFIRTEENCFPDGSIVDAEGFVLNAQWGGSKVVRYDLNGNVDSELLMPVSQPTCVAIGGADNNLLFVTSASEALTVPEAQAGSLFIYKTDCLGLPESRYRSNKTAFLG